MVKQDRLNESLDVPDWVDWGKAVGLAMWMNPHSTQTSAGIFGQGNYRKYCSGLGVLLLPGLHCLPGLLPASYIHITHSCSVSGAHCGFLPHFHSHTSCYWAWHQNSTSSYPIQMCSNHPVPEEGQLWIEVTSASRACHCLRQYYAEPYVIFNFENYAF